MIRILLYLVIITSVLACNPANNFDDVPTLTYVGMSKDTLNQGSTNQDSLFVRLEFTDGDGDITIIDDDQPKLNLLVIDDRTGFSYGKFSVPPIPTTGASNGISGDITILLYNACCVFPPDENIPACSVTPLYPTNELTLSFQLIDNAGNASNITQSTPINLKCR